MAEDFVYPAGDGLALAGRDFGPRDGALLPVVCLPGLTRTTRDFEELGSLFAARGRRVLAFDYRGRGRSQWDATGEGYTPAVELQDILAGMAARGVARAAIVGTSRGGILAMMLAAARREAVAAAVLNDIGSVVEPAGLARIRTYVGRGEAPADWQAAADSQRTLFGPAFPAYGEADWAKLARLTYADRNGRPAIDYDPALARGLENVTADMPPVDLSAAFSALRSVPVLLIRGSESDLLSPATVAAMRAAHPGLVVREVSGEGHPPMLTGRTASAIVDFVGGLA